MLGKFDVAGLDMIKWKWGNVKPWHFQAELVYMAASDVGECMVPCDMPKISLV